MTADLKTESECTAPSEDGMRLFLQQIRSYPRLTPEQEKELAKRCAQGDEDAIRTMVNSNLRLVVSIAKEYAGRGVPVPDLIQEGSIGLLTAAKKFDYTLDYRFSTYATKWIRQGVNRCILNHAGIIRVPLHTAEQIRKIIAVRASLQRDGEEPTLMQIASCCDMDEKRVEKLLGLIPEVCSLDAPAGEEEDATLQMFLENMTTPQPQEELVRRELDHILDQLLQTLDARQREVLRLHFGMEDGVCYSLEQIGTKFGISKERVRQIEHQAMDKLKKLGTDLGLEDFLR